jgi:hypothetical protein
MHSAIVWYIIATTMIEGLKRPLEAPHKHTRGSAGKKESLYPSRPTKDWYIKPPTGTEVSRDRYKVISTVTKGIEIFMFSPFGEEYNPKDYNHLSLRAYLMPNSKPERFFTQDETRTILEVSFGAMHEVAGLYLEKISPKVKAVADRSIRNIPLNNLTSAEWAQCQKEKLNPEEVMQLMALRIHHTTQSNNVIFNYWSNRDILEQTANSVLIDVGTQTAVGYLFKGGDVLPEKTSLGVTPQNMMKTILTLKEVNYFLGEPPLHQNLIDSRIQQGK